MPPSACATIFEALAQMNRPFEELYSQGGRPSIAPERLIRALLLQILYSIPSERLLVEQLEDNLLFRWFVGLSVHEPVWDHPTFSKTAIGCSWRTLRVSCSRRA